MAVVFSVMDHLDVGENAVHTMGFEEYGESWNRENRIGRP